MRTTVTNILFCVVLSLAPGTLCAQTYQKLSSLDSWMDRFKTTAAQVRSLQAGFVQSKYVTMLEEKIVSGGTFYFRQPDQISLHYRTPVPYQVVIAGRKMRVVSSGKSESYDLKDNTLTGEMQATLSACMSGNLSGLMNRYNIQVFSGGSLYKIEVTVKPGAQSYGISSVEVILDAKDFSMTKMVIRETSGDYTEYEFSAKKANIPLADSVFALR